MGKSKNNSSLSELGRALRSYEERSTGGEQILREKSFHHEVREGKNKICNRRPCPAEVRLFHEGGLTPINADMEKDKELPLSLSGESPSNDSGKISSPPPAEVASSLSASIGVNRR